MLLYITVSYVNTIHFTILLEFIKDVFYTLILFIWSCIDLILAEISRRITNA